MKKRSGILKKGNQDINEGNRNIDDNEGENKVVHNIESGQTYNVTRDYEGAVINNSTEVGFPNSVNDKVTINNDILNINDGDEEYIEKKEGKIVHEEEEWNI